MRSLNMKYISVLFFVILLVPLTGWTQEARLVEEDQVVEKRMLALTEDLRCLVCQNESIAGSRADFSNDIRREIRIQINANKTDEEIIEFLVERYGDFVLYDPPIKPTTLFLWFGPLLMFLVGVGAVVFYFRSRRPQVQEDTSLTEEEFKQAQALLNEKEGNNK